MRVGGIVRDHYGAKVVRIRNVSAAIRRATRKGFLPAAARLKPQHDQADGLDDGRRRDSPQDDVAHVSRRRAGTNR